MQLTAEKGSNYLIALNWGNLTQKTPLTPHPKQVLDVTLQIRIFILFYVIFKFSFFLSFFFLLQDPIIKIIYISRSSTFRLIRK